MSATTPCFNTLGRYGYQGSLVGFSRADAFGSCDAPKRRVSTQTIARPKISDVAQQIAAELGETTPGPVTQVDRIVRHLGEGRALAALAQAT